MADKNGENAKKNANSNIMSGIMAQEESWKRKHNIFQSNLNLYLFKNIDSH